MIINGSSYPLRIPLDSHPQDVSLKVYRGCLAWRGEGVVDPVELGPGEGVRVLLPDAQVDRGGEAGLAGEVGEGLCQAEQREEREEKHVEVTIPGQTVRLSDCQTGLALSVYSQ